MNLSRLESIVIDDEPSKSCDLGEVAEEEEPGQLQKKDWEVVSFSFLDSLRIRLVGGHDDRPILHSRTSGVGKSVSKASDMVREVFDGEAGEDERRRSERRLQ